MVLFQSKTFLHNLRKKMKALHLTYFFSALRILYTIQTGIDKKHTIIDSSKDFYEYRKQIFRLITEYRKVGL